MYYSNTPSKVYPDLNYFSGPFYLQHPFYQNTVSIDRCRYTQMDPRFMFLQGNENQMGFLPMNPIINAPKQVKVVLVQNSEKEKKEQLSLTRQSNFQISGLEKHSLETQISEQSDSEHHNLPKFTVVKNNFSNEIINEFNNYSKLKKIHSSYHLKRKISTKFQNDLRHSINFYISELNTTMWAKLPFMTSNSKEFRENVKNEFVKTYGEVNIAKFICEDVLVERRNPTNVGVENRKLIDKVDSLYQNNINNETLQKLVILLNKTNVKDYYSYFIESPRYKKCFEKDIEKYYQKLHKIENVILNEEKKQIFSKIYALKYDDIARNYFNVKS